MDTTASANNLTCLVTIHGMGFQQPPAPGVQGYADGLHAALQKRLPQMSGDPRSEFGRPEGEGAVYVHSDWPPESRKMEQGLHRLGTWKSDARADGQIDIDGVPLAQDGYGMCHVALVYSHLEDQGPHLGAALETATDAAFASGHYTSLLSAAHMLAVDLWAVFKHRHQAKDSFAPGLQVRRDAGEKTQHPNADGNPSGLLSVVQALDHDVATYVCRNDLRERVHDFVHEALLRVCARPDVTRVVVNSHSLGTVLAFDAARDLPTFAFKGVKCFVTAGSPLRKYADLFYWGEDAGCIVRVPWRNFWDPTDPVADPLRQPKEWRRGGPPAQNPEHPTLFYAYNADSGDEEDAQIADLEVDNAGHGAGGGLPAHNYWDNGEQFVDVLAGYLTQVAADQPIP